MSVSSADVSSAGMEFPNVVGWSFQRGGMAFPRQTRSAEEQTHWFGSGVAAVHSV